MSNQQADNRPNTGGASAAKSPDTSLLSNPGYFARYGEHLAKTGDKTAAWANVEADLQKAFGLRRFVSYGSFEVTFHKAMHGKTRNLNRVAFTHVGTQNTL